MKHDELEMAVVRWGDSKGIFVKSDYLKQLDKTQDELNETRAELLIMKEMEKGQLLLENEENPLAESDEYCKALDLAKLEVGDMLVTITLLCAFLGVSTDECLELAYHKIKTRTGKMVDGLFVKDEN